MRQNINQQARRQACAAAPCNERFTPKERECWHLRTINRLCNRVAALRKTYNHLYARNRVTEAKILTQGRTLCALHTQAHARNEEIARLQKRLQEKCGIRFVL